MQWKIYHEKENGERGHIHTGYFSLVCDVALSKRMQDILDELTTRVAIAHDVEEKCIHIENINWM